MSSNSVALNNGQQAIINTDINKIFIGGNRTYKYPYHNSAYDDVTIPAGTVMGVVSGTGYAKELASGASDGSQYPVGILLQDTVIEGGDLVDITLVVEGDVAENMLVFQGSDNLDVTVDGRRLRDRIGADTVGIKLVPSTDNTAYDNQ
jgi:hypothetical protein